MISEGADGKTIGELVNEKLNRINKVDDHDFEDFKVVKPVGPFPDRLLDVGGFIGDVMKFTVATAHRPQPVLALAGALTLQAVLAGQKVRDVSGNRPNIYIVSVAGSAQGKNRAREVNGKILFNSGNNNLHGPEDIASDAGIVATLDENPATLFQLDEMGKFLESIGSAKQNTHLANVITTFMRFYSTANDTYTGKAYADPRKVKEIMNPICVLHGTSTPDNFYQSLTTDSLKDGFVARLMVFESRERPVTRRVEYQEPPDQIIKTAIWWKKYLPPGNGGLHREFMLPRILNYTDEATAILQVFCEYCDKRAGAEDSVESAVWGRAVEKAGRLALIRAISDDKEATLINAKQLIWAMDVSKYLTKRMLELADQWVSNGSFDALQKEILRVVNKRGHGVMTGSQLYRATKHMSKRIRDEVIENLLITGQLIKESQQPKGAGRPKITYRVQGK